MSLEAWAPIPFNINDFRAKIEACRKCPLGADRVRLGGKICILRGSWNPKLMFIGEAPGVEEDMGGEPFIGKSGYLVDELVDRLPVKDTDVAMVNLVKCHPPYDHLFESAEKACRPYLNEQLAVMNPELIVLLGKKPWKEFFPQEKEDRWESYRAKVTIRSEFDRTRRYFPMFHPAYILYEPSQGPKWYRQGEALFEVCEKYIGYH